jgi:hypothetical protein
MRCFISEHRTRTNKNSISYCALCFIVIASLFNELTFFGVLLLKLALTLEHTY